LLKAARRQLEDARSEEISNETRFDAAYNSINTMARAYLAAASQDEDPRVLMVAMGNVVRARNVSKITRDAGMTREGVYKAFSVDGNPSFATVMKVARALDLEFSFRSRAKASRQRAANPRIATPRAAPKSPRRVAR